MTLLKNNNSGYAGKLLVLIFLLAAFLRFFRLSDYPVHLGHDEVSQLYDAISISETGKDIYRNNLPFIFKSVNDFKPPFYTYATFFAYKLFGWQDVTIRVTGAMFGTLMVLGVYFFANEFVKKKEVALIAAFLTAISPFEIFYSRKSFENQTGIFLMLLGFTLLKRKKIFLGIVLLGISSYIYFSQVILIPLLLIAYTIIFWKEAKNYFLKGFILFILIVSPLYYIIYTNPDASNRSKAVFITQDATIGGSQRIKVLSKIIDRYIKQFSPKYLFLDGLDMTNGKRDVGPLFAVTIPFLILGIYFLTNDHGLKFSCYFLVSWVLITMIPSSITFEEYSPHRALAAFTMLNIISSLGIYYFFKKFGKLTLFGVLILVILNFAFFIKRYIVNYPIERSEALHYPFRDISKFAWENYDKYDTIVFDPKFGEFAPWIGTGAHYYLAYYGKYDPAIMQKEFRIGDQKVRETKFGKFSIRAVYWPTDHTLKNTLIIASPWSLPPDIAKRANIIKIFYFKTTAPAFFAIEL
ncbi:MAG: glycosyltransferase family 39 protein [Patescibacteria group bacterium]